MPSLAIRPAGSAALLRSATVALAVVSLALTLTAGEARAATITLCPSGCDHTTLSAAVAAAAAGDVIEIGEGEYVGGVTIDKPMTLRGAGAEQVTLRGGGNVGPVLDIQNRAAGALDRAYAVRVEGLTITEGSGLKIDRDRYGSGIYIKGANVTIERCTIRDNHVDFDGGGIYNDAGLLSVRDSRVLNNRADNSGGGIYNDRDGTLELHDSVVFGNIAKNPEDVDPSRETLANGGGIVSRDRATITGTRIEANESGNWGGGMYVFGAGRVEIADTEFVGNTTTHEGGGIYNSAKVEMERMRFVGNRSRANGGGIFNMGEMTIDVIHFEGNRGANGGGLSVMKGFAASQVGELYMSLATFEGNRAASTGGGIYAEREAEVEITLCTVSDNEAQTGGGVRATDADKLELTECTVANNRALSGLEDSAAGVSVTEENVLRLAGTLVANDQAKDCQGPVRSDGHNLDEDASCGFTRNSDVSGGFAGLRDLDDYGGPLRTHGLTPSSDAIDAGHPNRCQDTDQRGVERPQDGDEDGRAVCDIGAFELEGAAPASPTPAVSPSTPTPVEPTPPGPTPSATSDTGTRTRTTDLPSANPAGGMRRAIARGGCPPRATAVRRSCDARRLGCSPLSVAAPIRRSPIRKESEMNPNPTRLRAWTPLRGALACALLISGLIAGLTVPTVHADEDPPDPTWLDQCQRYQLEEFEGRCPGSGNPQREDPWAPTINLEPPPDTMDCPRVRLHLDQIFLADCDGDGAPGGKIQPMLTLDNSAGVPGFFAEAGMRPDYGDDENGDILPIMECWDRDAMPSGISYKLDDPFFGEVYIERARLRMYCCQDC